MSNIVHLKLERDNFDRVVERVRIFDDVKESFQYFYNDRGFLHKEVFSTNDIPYSFNLAWENGKETSY